VSLFFCVVEGSSDSRKALLVGAKRKPEESAEEAESAEAAMGLTRADERPAARAHLGD
jgi:hypothetical protein